MPASAKLTTSWSFDASLAVSQTAAAAGGAKDSLAGGSTARLGGSLSAHVVRALSIPSVEVECSTCWAPIRPKSAVLFEPCSHPVCRPCAIQLLRSTLRPGARGITCPVCTDTGGWLPDEHPSAVASALRRRSSPGTGLAAIPVPVPTRTGSAPRPVFGQLTEQLVHRLHAWSARPTTVLPAGVRPLTVDDVSRFVRAQIEAAVADGVLPPGARGTAAASAPVARGSRAYGAAPLSSCQVRAAGAAAAAGGAGAPTASRAAPGSERIIRCWNPTCGAMLIAAVTDRAEGEACPHCREWLCVACGGQWTAHDGRSCGDVAKATAVELTATLLLNKRQGATFMLCPTW